MKEHIKHMLVRYRKSHKKIAMGLLSFMPEERDLKELQKTIKKYDAKEDRNLFLWKDEKDNIRGLIGVEMDGQTVIIRHVSVLPSHRGNGIGNKMIKALKEIYIDFTITGDKLTADFVEKCK